MTTRKLTWMLAIALTAGCAAKPDDEKIARALNQSLSAATGLSDIDATSANGEVTLSGTVTSEVDRSRAVQIAEGAEGVVKVHNALTLTSPAAELPQVGAPPPQSPDASDARAPAGS